MKRLLIANRGEIALRVMRTAREMGIATIAVYSEADRDALHARYADEAYLVGPAPAAQSYLAIERLLDVARRARADAVHPGYGFLAENATFARAVTDDGIVWVGPHADAIDAMGDKVRARRAMVAAGVPVVPGATDELADAADALRAADAYGLPLALKASGGGGGKGLKIARSRDDVVPAFEAARREALAYFANGAIYAERYLENPKHVELQLLADKHGTVVHLGERDCSLQRRHQKLYEETPAFVSERVRERLRDAGLRAARAIGYDSVGTLETLVAGDDVFFLEMNTRIQVEHTITEMTSGIDLVREQLRVAAGEPLGYAQDAIARRGHAIEVRVNAEDPANGFRPGPGEIVRYAAPAGFGVRVDAAVGAGSTVGADYDSLVAKLVVWAPTRDEARARLRRAIDDFEITGVPTTLPFLRALGDTTAVADATYGTATLEAFAATWAPTEGPASPARVASSAAPPEARELRVEVDDRLYRVRVFDDAPPARPAAPARTHARRTSASGRTSGDVVLAPMHGVVASLDVALGASVATDALVATIEAMKMINDVRAHAAGTVTAVHVRAGETVEADAPLVTIAAAP